LIPNTAFYIALVVLLAGVLAWAAGLPRVLKRARANARRILLEDALKHIMKRQTHGPLATPESLAGALKLNMERAVDLVQTLQRQGLAETSAAGLRLTSQGEAWALQLIRAHRLWERYLADHTAMSWAELHTVAERREHQTSPAQADALDALLGYPKHDPHGDPIPSVENGTLALDPGQPLCDWPVGQPAQIVHIEDEPAAVYAQILSEGLLPGVIVTVMEECTERGLHLRVDGVESWMAPVVAANISVAPIQPEEALHETRLAALRPGQAATVVRLDFSGLDRWRLEDLGLLPGTRVVAEMRSPLGEPTAYRVRGALIALRKEQAQLIRVKPEEIEEYEETTA
jgi:DtxR family Mn-dependent transcriptional regulator